MLTHRFDGPKGSIARNNNTTLTTDFFLRPNDAWTVNGLLSASRDEGLGRLGHAGNLYAGVNLNKLYAGWATKWVSADYLPGMGFVFGRNVVHHNPGGYYIWRPKEEKSIFRRGDPGFFINYYHSATNGKFQQADVYLFPIYQWFRDNSFLEVSFTPTWQNIDFDFRPLNIAVSEGRYFYVRNFVRYNTDMSRKLSADVGVNFGKFYSGRLLTLNTGIRIAPTPYLALKLDYELNRARSLGPMPLTKMFICTQEACD
jgi:hypothetical protein